MKPVKLISSGVGFFIRREPIGRMAGIGEVERKIATGRSRCRVCGERIKKGEFLLATHYDFYGGGLEGDPWTGTEIHIHINDCEKERSDENNK